MVNFDFLMIMLVVTLVAITIFQKQLWNLIWKIFNSFISSDKLEKLVRQEFECFELNQRAYNDEGVSWLLEMARYFQKIKKCQKCTNSDFFNVFSFWKNAEEKLETELYRREYFRSLT